MLKLPTHVVRILRGSLQPEARDVAFVPPVAVTSMLFIAQKAAPNIGATWFAPKIFLCFLHRVV